MPTPAAFEIAHRFTARMEGGFVNNPSDPGGATNYGVSLRWLRSLGPEVGDFDDDDDVDIDDIRRLTPELARLLFHARFWDAYHCDDYPREVGIALYDCMVNSGPARSIRIMQEAANFYPGYAPVLAEDGIAGPKTRARVHEVCRASHDGALVLAKVMIEARRRFYARIIAANPRLGAFKRGWNSRCDQLIDYLEGL